MGRAGAEPAPPGRISIGITTFNRPDFCVEHLRTLGAAPEVLDLLDAVLRHRPGHQARSADHPDFADAAEEASATSCGSSSRATSAAPAASPAAMDETRARRGTATTLLILDDDIICEPESILRAVTFADLARKPTIVGGHMFSLYDRSVLHAFGEVVAPRKWWWGASPNTKARHDFGRRNLRNTPWLHRRVDADYNGWWMCLIPTKIIARAGLAMPVFIKWDDAEYGAARGRRGLPDGVAARAWPSWHIPWLDKNDALDWQAYFHHPQPVDRGAAALAVQARRPPDRGKRRAPAAEPAVDAVLHGGAAAAGHRGRPVRPRPPAPRPRHEDGQLRELRQQFTDARGSADLEDFPPARRKARTS